MIEPQAYLHTDTYHAALDALEAAALAHDPAESSSDLRTRLIMALGEVGGIWPISCFTGEGEGAVIVAA